MQDDTFTITFQTSRVFSVIGFIWSTVLVHTILPLVVLEGGEEVTAGEIKRGCALSQTTWGGMWWWRLN